MLRERTEEEAIFEQADAAEAQGAPLPSGYDEPVEEEGKDESVNERMQGIVSRLAAEADDRVAKRQPVEARWLDDLRQYHGYADTLGRTKDESKVPASTKKQDTRSTLHINETRTKTNAMAAKLGDLLFPTDDKNWGIKPTPVPQLTEDAKKAVDAAERALAEANAAEEQAVAAAQAQDPAAPQAIAAAEGAIAKADSAQALAKRFQAEIDEARRRADRMGEEIDDQLKEAAYNAACRDVIEEACKIGSGVMEGPIVGDKTRGRWMAGNGGQWVMEQQADPRPRIQYISAWSFFPDNDAKTVAESESFYVRHLMNRKDLRKLAKTPGFDKDAIKRLIGKGNKPRGALPSYLNELRAITGDSVDTTDERFQVWKFTGPLECEDIKLLAEAMGDEALAREYEANEDPLLEVNAVVWFCDDQLLKFSIHPLDSGEPLYSVFNLEKDEASIWGYGVPYVMRDPQSAIGAAWRMMLDNAGLSVGPQIVIDREKIEPADGLWELRPRKIWLSKVAIAKDERPFQVFEIAMHQQELAGIIQLAKQFIDDVTGITALAQGEQGQGVTKTAQGMALLMNSTNVVFRRIVKNFDDDLTVPNLRRIYDWNMQFSKKEEIKGDYDIDARGSSVLLVREMQAQNLMTLAVHFGGHPVYGVMLKHADMLRTIFRAHMLKADEHVLDDEAIAKVQKKMAEAQDAAASSAAAKGKTPEELELDRERMQLDAASNDADNATRRYIADKNYEATMAGLAEKLNMTAEQVRAKLFGQKMTIDHQERSMAVEAAVAARTGEHAGGAV